MEIIILLIGISLCIAVIFLVIFFWSVRSGQYDDTYTPSVRMLFDKPTGNQRVKSADNSSKSKDAHSTNRVNKSS